MNVHDAIRARRSVRAYEKKDVEEAKLARVLEAARLAPSASNRQALRLVVVRDEATRLKLAKAASSQMFIAEAPVVLAAVATDPARTMACGEKSGTVDCAIALDHVSLAAVAEGLGTCWIGAFDEPAVRAILGIPDSCRVVELMPLGYPAESPAARARKPLDEFISYDRWK